MNLGAHLDSSQYVTLNSFFKAIGISGGYTYSLGILKKAGLKIHMQKVNRNSFKMIDIDEFWIFAEKNCHLIDFSRFEEIDRFIHKVLNDEHYIMGDMCWDVAELKKKYTEGKI